MIQTIKHRKRQYATKETNHLTSKILDFCNLYRLHIFCNYFQMKYVGTTCFDSQKILTDISFNPSNLQMVYNHRSGTISLTPDDLFSHDIEFLPLLLPNALTWLFSLVIFFFHALPLELQETMRLGGYIYLIFRVNLPLFYKNRRYKIFVNTQLPLSSYL